MTSTPPSRPPAERTLLGTADAMVWADEFCRLFKGWTITDVPQDVHGMVDPGGMVVWFANAMQVAIDRHDQEVAEVEEIEAEVYDQDDDDEDEPSLEESFLEGFQEGRD